MDHAELGARYSGPVLQLALLDRARETRLTSRTAEWPDYAAMGIGPQHVSDLLRMATDVGLVVAPPDEAAGWGQIHATRALAQLGAKHAAAKIVEFACWMDDDELGEDWQMEEFPAVMAMMGPESADLLHAALDTPDENERARVALVCAIAEVAKHHPSTRDRAVARLAQTLRASGDQWEVATFAVYELVELKAVEAIDDIRAAFERKAVDYFVVDWFDLREKFGIEEDHPEWCRMTPEERARAKERMREYEEEWSRSDAEEAAGTAAPTRAKKPADKAKKKKAEKQKRKDRKRNRR